VIRGLDSREKLLLLANPGILVEHVMQGNVTMEVGSNKKSARLSAASRVIGVAAGAMRSL
jgi:hypothetical protein